MNQAPSRRTVREPAIPAPRAPLEDEAADPVGDGRSDAELATTQPPLPGRAPPVSPDDLGADLPAEHDAPPPDDPDDDTEPRAPGRA